MAKKDQSTGKRVQSGPLSGHYKFGRRYRPPIMALPGSTPNDWSRDDLPDLLWPLMLVSVKGDEAAVTFRQFQELFISAAGEGVIEKLGLACDGRLTSLERVPAEAREELLSRVRDHPDLDEFLPSAVIGVLRLYPSLPGSWILVAPWRDRESPSPEESLNFLARSLVRVISDRHLNALVKTAPLGWLILNRRVHLPKDVIDLLVDYPGNPATKERADAMILSSFLSFKAADEHQDAAVKTERLNWARAFWGTNRNLSECLYEDDLREAGSTERPSPDSPQGSVETREEGHEVVSIDDLVSSYLNSVDSIFHELVEAFFDRSRDMDLLSPARSEVLSALATRACRSTAAILMAPHMWTGEHGAGYMRLLLETIVVIKWLLSQPGDDAFDGYQAYGEGKRKLQTQQVKDLASKVDGEVQGFLQRVAEQLERKSGGEWSDQFTEVNVEATFSGLSLRAMAEGVGELERYNRIYQTASGIGHAEWWALEDYAMERCRNPLHRFHWIPRLKWDSPSVEPQFPKILLSLLRESVDLALSGFTGIAETLSDSA